MRIHMSHKLWITMMLVLLSCCRAAPGNTNFISGSQLDSEYVEKLMRLSKAAEMASFMNENVNPCDNFYDFACGSWAKINPANTDSDRTTGLFERLTHGLHRKVKQMLDNDNDPLDTPEDVQVKSFYKSCTRISKIDKSYQQKLKELIAEFGSMPALEGNAWQESDFDWLETIARIAHRYGLGIIFNAEVQKDVANNEVNVVYLGQQEFLLESRGMYLDNHTAHYRAGYRMRIAKKLQTFLGFDRKLALTTATELVSFEIQLAHGLINEADGLDLMDLMELTTVEEMQRTYAPILDVERLVNITIGEQINDSVYDYNPDYQKNLVKVMQRTNKSNVANYIFYQLIDSFSMDLGKTPAKQEQQCIDATKKYFSKNLDNMVYRRHNNNATAADIELIWRQLKHTFRQALQSEHALTWIAADTRDLALKKLFAMTLQVNSHVDEDLGEEFIGVQLQSVDYVENLRQIFIKAARMNREQLHKPVKPLDAGDLLSFSPANVLVENTIKVPVSVLQPYYMWAASYPKAIKFGTLAVLIGHELIHGFDDSGRKFDARGNINNWWDDHSTSKFLERQQCFTEQYSRYIYNGKQLPKMISQSENIADNGGLRLAYEAYRNVVHGKEGMLKEKLPTLNYTNRQLFFISFAQIWCNDVHPGLRDALISTDQHVPGKFRVIGPLSNFEEFSEEFQCKLGTLMNPVKKCKIY